MRITRNSLDTAAGREDWFTGAVYVDRVAVPSDASRISASDQVSDDQNGAAPTIDG